MTNITIRTGSLSYEVIVGTGLLNSLGSTIAKKITGGRCAVVADENTARLFGERVVESLRSERFEPSLIIIPAGEKSKSLEQVEAVCDEMVRAGLDRQSFLVALGGGVVGDLAGFVAAVFHRGIPYVQVPTTLLAQVDSSIGGKTAVNITSGKNLIGAVHHPVLVISDVDVLKTLPPREFNQGVAEIIKHGIIRDPALFNSLEKLDRDNLAPLVRRNIEIKAEFVARDERDTSGERALLNFGHTIGHAIEAAGEYRELLHGEAVSLGIVAACDISIKKVGLPEQDRHKIMSILQRFDLPTRLPENISREKILDAVQRDKKFERGQVRFVIAPRIGSAHVAHDVTMEDIRAAVAQL
ncbi:MAG: 3-dehydroquinate synthase [Verrucomicrobiota bacterium]